jgi:hypothetical protein
MQQLAPDAVEVKLAEENITTLVDALRSVLYHQREDESTIVYRQRIVCYLSANTIEVLDLDQTGEWTDQVLLGSLVNRSEHKSKRYKVRLLNYNEGILVLHFVGESAEDGGHILAFRLDKAAAT